MKVRSILKSVVLGLACLGLTLGQADVLAGTPTAKSTAKKVKVSDVQLDAKGVLNGIVANKEGRAVINTEVTIAQGKKSLAKTKTNARGEFQFKKLRGGTYHVVVGKQVAHIRVWTHRAAPPNAMKQALLVSKPVVRAQGAISLSPLGGAVGLFNLAAGITTITMTAINNSDINDLQDDVNVIQQDVNDIKSSNANANP